MTDPQLRSQGTQPPPPTALVPPPRSYSQPNPLSAPTKPVLADPGSGAPAVRIHPAAEPRVGGSQNRGRNARRVPAAPSAHILTVGPTGGRPALQPSLSRRMSSEDSGETEQSDPSKWFDRSNENPAEAFGPRGMDVDPPFFQKETDSSNEDISKEISSSQYPFNSHLFPPPPLKPTVTTSTSEDYRSVIDDLTVEIKRLKEELRRYKQNVPDSLKRDALFEVRVHGLDRTKKRELEHTLRDFATSVSGSSGGSSGRQKTATSSGRANRTTGSWGTGSKITSPAGNSRLPADSAYASMSNAGYSTNPTANAASTSSVVLPGRLGRARSAEQKVKSYLEGVPEGLHPKNVILSENEKKKLVVRRLEKIFTGKMGGRQHDFARPPPLPHEPSQARSTASLPPNPASSSEATREAKMLTVDNCGHRKGHHHHFRDNGSNSMSTGDQTESGAMTSGNGSGGSGNGNGSGSGNSGNGNRSGRNSGRWTQSSPSGNAVKYEQRPTRPYDLDPDRVFTPSENMEYFRHLGIAPPSNLSETLFSAEDVAPDADGWVWLNLICNMAHIHMLNVTPSYVRKAVAEKSRRLQVSPDGQKIRWRGGIEGTKFSGESSGDNSRGSPLSEEDSSPNSTKQRKKAKTQRSTAVDSGTRSSESGNNLRFTPRTHDRSPNSFHYKPLFAHQASSMEQTSDEGLSYGSPGQGLDSNGNSNSGFGNSGLAGFGTGSGRQRPVGSIMYYHGAPFCTDLSKEPVDTSASSSQVPSPESSSPLRPGSKRTISGSILPTRPLSLRLKGTTAPGGKDRLPQRDLMQVDEEEEEYIGNSSCDTGDEETDDDDMFPWADDSEEPPRHRVERLEAAGLGGVIPDDHFLVMVTTRRPKLAKRRRSISRSRNTPSKRQMSEDATDSIVARVARLTTTSPAPPPRVPSRVGNPIEIQYLSGKAKRLEPSPQPPAATFIPPFSSDDEDEDDMELDFSEDPDESSEIVQLADDVNDREEELSRLANPHLSDNTSDEAELSSGDEEDEIDAEVGYDASDSSGAPALDLPMTGTLEGRRAGSSAATAGGLESGLSGYDSSDSDGDVEME